jgi:hypothetical protein
MKTLLTLACFTIAAQAAVGQDTFANRITAGVSIISTHGNYYDFTANRLGFGVEVTCDLTKNPENALNFRGFFSYFAVSGKEHEVIFNINTATQMTSTGSTSLNGMSLGAEVTFKTPWPSLVPHAGLMLTKWSGSASGFENLAERQLQYDNAVKFGLRLGADYSITEHLIAGVNFSLSEWRSHRDYAANTSNPLMSNGFNPVSPSWVNITCRWRF